MRLIFVANTAYEELKNTLRTLGTLIEIKASTNLYHGIGNHADLHIHIIDNHLFLSQSVATYLVPILEHHHINYTIIKENLEPVYPNTVYLNAVSTNDFFIHPRKFTAKSLKNHVINSNRTWLNLKQGYVRCTTLPLKHNALITSDLGVAKVCRQNCIDYLQVSAGNILLDHHEYGFIGGTAGCILDTVYFNGNISNHPDYKAIKDYCALHNLTISQISSKALKDIGSILVYEGDSTE